MLETRVIEVKNARKYFKTVKAVNGVDLEVNPGEYLALLGPNGAGKTTLVEMIEGIQKPDSGEILVMGKKWKGNEESLHRLIGLSLQETKFFDKLTVIETFRVFASFYGLDFNRADEVMDMVNLVEKKKSYVVNLSGGQRQKLALGIALLNFPKILLLDEPTTGLDPVARREIWSILMELKKEKNTSMILTTHYMEEAELLCNRIVILDHGKILAQGTLDELLQQNKTTEMMEFSLNAKADIMQFQGNHGIRIIEWNENNFSGKIILEDITSFLPVISKYLADNNLELNSFVCRKMTLDDLFVSLTGRKLTD